MDLLSTTYIYVTELRELGVKRYQSPKEIKLSEKVDFIGNQRHNPIHDGCQMSDTGQE